ncbi:hypothetical protein [Nonomuraea sp. CA-141351]|uniref:hypothetical protein n=1 Tax=Nonomuraea sp. CA-141351 TaxID=3239996 RepID=UPI003D8E1288
MYTYVVRPLLIGARPGESWALVRGDVDLVGDPDSGVPSWTAMWRSKRLMCARM